MPYVPQKDLSAPPGNTVLRRHISLADFIAMLTTRQLWCSRVSELADKFEGSYPIPNAMLRRMVGESIDRRRLPSEVPDEYIRRYSDRKLAELRNGVYVNCWYSGPHESAAIWQWASRSGMAVAIESSFASLIASVRSPEPFRAGTVTYHDYDTESVPERSRLRVFFCKRTSFEHEHEVRLLIDRTKPKMERPSKGLLLPVDLENLIRRVIVAPLAEDYILEVVRALVASFGPAVGVVRSRLDDDPVY